ncbi:hypothetical protein C1Y63_04980 [Corynebacterium sp. 13CS0277]|nr:hypothetical protein C1Y63_04980 [Corynebacterium sp. 13CS0277]
MSKRGAAALAGISETRYRQVELGWWRSQGEWVPVTVPAGTLSTLANTVGADVSQVLKAAGFDAATVSHFDTQQQIIQLLEALPQEKLHAVLGFIQGQLHS